MQQLCQVLLEQKVLHVQQVMCLYKSMICNTSGYIVIWVFGFGIWMFNRCTTVVLHMYLDICVAVFLYCSIFDAKFIENMFITNFCFFCLYVVASGATFECHQVTFFDFNINFDTFAICVINNHVYCIQYMWFLWHNYTHFTYMCTAIAIAV